MKHDRTLKPKIPGISRRALLQTSACAAGAGMLGLGFPGYKAQAASGTVKAVMPGVFMPDQGRPVVEEKFGVKLENLPYVSPTDTLAKLMAPGGTSSYDLMISVTPFVRGPVMGESSGDEQLMALDMSKIPNAKNIMPLFNDSIVKRDGNTYMLPIVWGYDSVLYNTDHVPEDDESTHTWKVLFDDRYKGRVALRDEPHQSVMVAALAMGVEDPVKMDKSDLAEVQKFLISKKGNIRTLWTKFGEAVNLMSSGEVWAMYGWIAMRAALQKQGHNVTNNWPSDGLIVWDQSGFVPKDAPNPEGAHAVINAMLSDEFGKILTDVTNYPSTSEKVAALYDADKQRELGFDVSDRGVKLYPMAWPENMDMWIETWAAFKAA